ncbi:dienelactone hydrolase family protein [Oxynema sp. CENA135]|uniref:dienelactone hydrolase family protein n=1 Tax=Oxynema sp. CENA135 TaxID=984206 RepID=UPI00190D580E|nr:dienelactone hydrolase family protein [Oxynema sp. CENA135]MBK4730146.1 dienelactone hydrolase family protein [Oxynema sp. CENA135]
MPDLAIETAPVKIPNGDLQIAAYLAQPVGTGPFPCVIVFQEVFGVNAHIREVTERIAKQGYIAIAPAIYQRTAPDFEVGYSDADLALGRKYKEQTTADELLSDTRAAIAYLKTLPSARTEAFGCIGFCFGGHVAYLAATLPEIQATASCYGAGIVTTCPGGGEPTVTRTPQISGAIDLFFGTEDPLIPNEQVDRLETELQKHGIRHRIFRYEGATHGFLCDARPSYNQEAAADAWTGIFELFRDRLQTP